MLWRYRPTGINVYGVLKFSNIYICLASDNSVPQSTIYINKTVTEKGFVTLLSEQAGTQMWVLAPTAKQQTIPSSLSTVGTPLILRKYYPIILCLFCPAAFCLEALPSGGTNPAILLKKKSTHPSCLTLQSPSNMQTTPSFFFCLLSPWLYLAFSAYSMPRGESEKAWHSPI